MCDFEEWIRPVRERVDWLRPERLTPYPPHTHDYVIAANWALYCDNYLEGFHVPYVHGASLGSKLDYDAYDTKLFEWSNVQIGVAAPGQPSFDLPKGHPDEGARIAAWYFWLFPNLMLNFYPWGLSLNVVQPLGPGRTRVLFRSYVSDPDRIADSAGSDLHRVEMEDEEIVRAAHADARVVSRRSTGAHLAAAVALLLGALAPPSLSAQLRAEEEETGWPALEVGARVGLMNVQQDFVLGGLLRIPVWRTGHAELLPSADVTFLGPFNEYQVNLEAAYLLMGRNGGPYVGGGIGFRSTIPPAGPGSGTVASRRWLTTYNILVGLKLTGLGPVNPLVEFRRAFVSDLEIDPQVLSLGASVMLW
jgi:hypothetical protein